MPYCDRCERYFASNFALRQHKQDSPNHYICDDCDIDFTSWESLKKHWISSRRHAYCQYCEEHFDDEDDLEDHFESQHYYCSKCKRVFKNPQGLREHYRQSEEHHYCADCDRDFVNETCLRNHRNSSIHREKDVKCPLKNCGQKFVSRSALVLHLEGGACESGMDRQTVNKLVRKYDKKNIITDPSRFITGPDGDSDDEDMPYIATPRAWNGSAYECVLCHSEHSSLRALNQHLASPRHQAKIYICRYRDCESRFSTLSAFVQHVESEKCGVSKFKLVQDNMDRILGQMKRLTM